MKAEVYASKGDQTEARRLLAEVEGSYGQEVLSPFRIGVAHFFLGESELCYHWFNRALNEHDPNIMLLNIEPGLGSIRKENRFRSLLERVGLGEHATGLLSEA